MYVDTPIRMCIYYVYILCMLVDDNKGLPDAISRKLQKRSVRGST